MTIRNVSSGFRFFGTVDKSEIDLFGKLSSQWWNKNGILKPLHSLNKVRIPFIRNGLIECIENEHKFNYSKPLKGFQILDIGCGGGILSEPLSRLGAKLTSIDADSDAIVAAKHHASENNIGNINYINSSIEEHSKANSGIYDGVVASEILEHVTSKEEFIALCVKCLKPGGSIFITTMNKTVPAEFLGIRAAEMLGIVPDGAHDIEKFVHPHDLQRILEKNQCRIKTLHGMGYNFITNEWCWISNTYINYALHAVKLQ